MTLLALPPEILSIIAGATLPEGYETFMLVCKTFFQAGERYLEKHKSLTKRYRNFYFASSATRERTDVSHSPKKLGCATPMQLLANIYTEPLIARYIVIADLTVNLSSLKITDPDLEIICSREELESFIVQSPYFTGSDIDLEKWVKFMRQEDEDARSGNLSFFFTTVFLLTLLPNLEVVRFDWRWGNFPRVVTAFLPDERRRRFLNAEKALQRLLEIICQKVNEVKHSGASLSKLRVINPSWGTGNEMRTALTKFCPFLSLGSLTTFRCGGSVALTDGHTGKPFSPETYTRFGNNLETIELAGCATNSIDFRKLLSRTPNLKTLRLAYETKWYGCGQNFDAGAFVDMIQDETKSTLEVLSLTLMTTCGQLSTGIVSMKKFERLRELELDTELLLWPPYKGLPDVAANATSGLPARTIENLRVPKLVDLLPSSIEKVKLISSSSYTQYDGLQSLLTDFEAERNVKLPLLSDFAIELLYQDQYPEEKFEVLVGSVDCALNISKTRSGRRSSIKKANFLQNYLELWNISFTGDGLG